MKLSNDLTPQAYDLAICPLASGSRGNATFISDGTTSILVDAGLSGIEIQRRLISKGIRPESIDAVLVSHEHGDHIKGVGVLSRRFDLTVYATPKTMKATGTALGRIDKNKIRHFECGSAFHINTLNIRPFSISHDAADPAGFILSRNKTQIGIATDLGVATSVVKKHLKNCKLLFIEANHDPKMLIAGPYPWYLKQRVKSRTGHLSNYESKALLKEIFHKNLQHVILGHLSEQNNTPEKALKIVGQALKNTKTRLSVACQNSCGDLIFIK